LKGNPEKVTVFGAKTEGATLGWALGWIDTLGLSLGWTELLGAMLGLVLGWMEPLG
jgi:hypothetical protein